MCFRCLEGIGKHRGEETVREAKSHTSRDEQCQPDQQSRTSAPSQCEKASRNRTEERAGGVRRRQSADFTLRKPEARLVVREKRDENREEDRLVEDDRTR